MANHGVILIRADETPEKWIQVVLRKLFEDHRLGADFKHSRWIFNWDESLTSSLNRVNILYEHNALRTISASGVVRLDEKEVNKSSVTQDRYNRLIDYKLNSSIYNKPNDDNVINNYSFAVWITYFDYKRFLQQCKIYNVSTNIHNVTAKLRFEHISTPVVTAGRIDYMLSSMALEGKAFRVIEYSYNNPQRTISLDELNRNLRIKGTTNLRELLKQTHFSYRNGALKPFLSVKPQSIKLKPRIKLSPGELKLIEASSTYVNR